MGLFTGLGLFFDSLSLFRTHKKLKKLALIPGVAALIATFVLFLGSTALIPQLSSWLGNMTESGASSWFSSWLGNGTESALLFKAISAIGALIITVLLAPFMVMLIALPLCEPLAAEVDRLHGGEEVQQGLIDGVIRGVTLSLKLVVIGVGGSLILSVLSLMPVIGLLAVPFNLLVFTPFILALDLTDFVFARRGTGLADRVSHLKAHLTATIGLGIITVPLVSIPFLNLIGAPIAVIMGTLYARRIEAKVLGQE